MRPLGVGPRWRKAQAVVTELAIRVNPGDGCIECGYAFHYEPEGCDACAPITVLLVAAGLAHNDGDRS